MLDPQCVQFEGPFRSIGFSKLLSLVAEDSDVEPSTLEEKTLPCLPTSCTLRGQCENSSAHTNPLVGIIQ